MTYSYIIGDKTNLLASGYRSISESSNGLLVNATSVGVSGFTASGVLLDFFIRVLYLADQRGSFRRRVEVESY